MDNLVNLPNKNFFSHVADVTQKDIWGEIDKAYRVTNKTPIEKKNFLVGIKKSIHKSFIEDGFEISTTDPKVMLLDEGIGGVGGKQFFDTGIKSVNNSYHLKSMLDGYAEKNINKLIGKLTK